MKVCDVCGRCFQPGTEFCSVDGSELSASERYPSVSVVGGYTLDRLLHRNAAGEIFLATRLDCGTVCEIVFSEATGADREQFLKDADRASKLFHPDLADLYEFGTLDGGGAYVVREAFTGDSLRSVLEGRGALDLLTAVRIARRLAESVHALHGAGLTHHGVEPRNISVDLRDEELSSVRLYRPDLAGRFVFNAISNRFAIDSEIDSIKYLAPEYFTGGEIGVKSDVYSLGVVLYELLSGTAPFDGVKASAIIEMHLHSRPPEVKIENLDLRMLLGHTLMESLQKQPSFRQASANVFARQLRHIEQLATHVSTPPPAVQVAPTPRVERPVVVMNEARPNARPVIEAQDKIADTFLPTTPPVEAPIAVFDPPRRINDENPAPAAHPTPRQRLREMRRRLKADQHAPVEAQVALRDAAVPDRRDAGSAISLPDPQEVLKQIRNAEAAAKERKPTLIKWEQSEGDFSDDFQFRIAENPEPLEPAKPQPRKAVSAKPASTQLAPLIPTAKVESVMKKAPPASVPERLSPVHAAAVASRSPAAKPKPAVRTSRPAIPEVEFIPTLIGSARHSQIAPVITSLFGFQAAGSGPAPDRAALPNAVLETSEPAIFGDLYPAPGNHGSPLKRRVCISAAGVAVVLAVALFWGYEPTQFVQGFGTGRTSQTARTAAAPTADSGQIPAKETIAEKKLADSDRSAKTESRPGAVSSSSKTERKGEKPAESSESNKVKAAPLNKSKLEPKAPGNRTESDRKVDTVQKPPPGATRPRIVTNPRS